MKTEISIKNIKSKFIDKVEELSGENIYTCYQCGKCSAGCPSISEMDISPCEIIRLVQLGQEKFTFDILNRNFRPHLYSSTFIAFKKSSELTPGD